MPTSRTPGPCASLAIQWASPSSSSRRAHDALVAPRRPSTEAGGELHVRPGPNHVLEDARLAPERRGCARDARARARCRRGAAGRTSGEGRGASSCTASRAAGASGCRRARTRPVYGRRGREAGRARSRRRRARRSRFRRRRRGPHPGKSILHRLDGGRVVVANVRRTADDRHAVCGQRACHFDRGVDVPDTVVEARQHVAVRSIMRDSRAEIGLGASPRSAACLWILPRILPLSLSRARTRLSSRRDSRRRKTSAPGRCP